MPVRQTRHKNRQKVCNITQQQFCKMAFKEKYISKPIDNVSYIVKFSVNKNCSVVGQN